MLEERKNIVRSSFKYVMFILVECTWHLKKGVSEIWGGVLAYCSCDKQVIGGRDLKWGKCSTEGNG